MRNAGKRPRKSLRTWGLGCGMVAAIPFLFLVVVTSRTCAPLQSAGEARAELLERYGPPGQFSLSAGGGIEAGRVESFLQVRRSLVDICARFQGLEGSMQRVDELGDREDATGEEIAGTTGGLAKVAANITPLIGAYFDQRNRSLLEAEMGFGEYILLYTLAYHEQLLDSSGPRGIFTAGGKIRPEAGSAIRAMLQRQLAELDRQGGADELRGLLRREIDALQADPTRVPFSDGLPSASAGSLAPYRLQLDEGFCPVLVEIEMDLEAGPALYDAIY